MWRNRVVWLQHLKVQCTILARLLTFELYSQSIYPFCAPEVTCWWAGIVYRSVWATRFPIHRACGHFSFDTNVEHKLNFAVPVSSSLSTWKPSMLFACKSCVIQFLYIAWPWTTSLWFDKKAEIVFSLCCRCPPLSGWLKAGRMCRSVFQMES